MSKFIKLSELKDKQLKAEEMKKVKGGLIIPVLCYAIVASFLLPK